MGTVWDPEVLLVMIFEFFGNQHNRTYPEISQKLCFYIVKLHFFARANRTKKPKNSNAGFRTPAPIYELLDMAPTRIQACEIGPGMVV